MLVLIMMFACSKKENSNKNSKDKKNGLLIKEIAEDFLIINKTFYNIEIIDKE